MKFLTFFESSFKLTVDGKQGMPNLKPDVSEFIKNISFMRM